VVTAVCQASFEALAANLSDGREMEWEELNRLTEQEPR
jgi:hypothetical protein